MSDYKNWIHTVWRDRNEGDVEVDHLSLYFDADNNTDDSFHDNGTTADDLYNMYVSMQYRGCENEVPVHALKDLREAIDLMITKVEAEGIRLHTQKEHWANLRAHRLCGVCGVQISQQQWLVNEEFYKERKNDGSSNDDAGKSQGELK
ncbi:MAG: hypothetical protein ACJ8R9_10795 [Steroidobacteraceae bacterium]